MDALDRLIARQEELDARLRVIEGGQRVGLADHRSSWMTAPAFADVFGTQSYGPSGATWTDDRGNTGTGYPVLTMSTGTRVLVEWWGRLGNVANAAPYRSAGAQISVFLNGLQWDPLLPNPFRQLFNGAPHVIDMPIGGSAIRSVPPGQNVFRMAANFFDTRPAETGLPALTEAMMIVTPLSVA